MAVTVNNIRRAVVGDRDRFTCDISSGWADGDTIDTGLASVENAQATPNDTAIAAADAISVTASGGVLTLDLIGTARAYWISAIGKRKA